MAAYDTYTVDSIDGGVGQFKVEKGQVIGKAFELFISASSMKMSK